MSEKLDTDLASSNYHDSLAEDYQVLHPLSWRPFIDSEMQRHVLEVVHMVAKRLEDPNQLVSIAKQAEQQASSFFWGGASLATGLPSIVLPFLYLSRAFPNQGWEQQSHLYIRLAAESTSKQPLMQPGMFGGTSGLALALLLLSQTDERYLKTSNKLMNQLCSQVLEKQWRRVDGEVIMSDFDIINGASGILACLLSTTSKEQTIQDAIYKLLEYLIWLAGNDEKTGRERWLIEPQYYPVEQYHQHYPNGFFDCGLSHGIPGPLAALSLAWLAGYQVEGQRNAILNLGTWIKNHTVQDQLGGLGWPSGIPLELSYSAELWSKLPPTRTAWCYGTPGISRALWLAGKALRTQEFCNISIQGIESVIRLPVKSRNIDSPTLCHGLAGLLMVCLRFAHETENSTVKKYIPQLTQQILDLFNPSYALGFRDEESTEHFVDDPGLLTGVCGTLLVLLATSSTIEPDWDRAFLVA